MKRTCQRTCWSILPKNSSFQVHPTTWIRVSCQIASSSTTTEWVLVDVVLEKDFFLTCRHCRLGSTPTVTQAPLPGQGSLAELNNSWRVQKPFDFNWEVFLLLSTNLLGNHKSRQRWLHDDEEREEMRSLKGFHIFSFCWHKRDAVVLGEVDYVGG